MPDETLFIRISDFIRQQTGYKQPILRDTDLNEDIRLIYEDAESLMAAYFETFSVNQGDFDFSRYFSFDAFNPFALIGALLSRKRKRERLPPLTAGMLEKAARRGAWNTQEIESHDQ